MQVVWARCTGSAGPRCATCLPKIFEFAGDKVSDNIDLPIRHYSTGMKVRLGFAVVAHLLASDPVGGRGAGGGAAGSSGRSATAPSRRCWARGEPWCLLPTTKQTSPGSATAEIFIDAGVMERRRPGRGRSRRVQRTPRRRLVPPGGPGTVAARAGSGPSAAACELVCPGRRDSGCGRSAGTCGAGVTTDLVSH